MNREGAPDANTNAVKHGAFSQKLRDQPARRGRLAELEEQASGREGLLELLTDRCVRAVMMCEIIESYVIQRKNEGADLDDIPALNKLPAFMNTAARTINSLLQQLPAAGSGASDELKHILEVIDQHDKQDK